MRDNPIYRAANIKSRQCNPLWRGLRGFVRCGFFDATVTVDTTMVSIFVANSV